MQGLGELKQSYQMNNTDQLQKELDLIKARNRKVELDKAWETSLSRKIIVAVLTYIVIVVFFIIANLPNPYINSIVPTTAFLLSTSSLPIFKKVWIKVKKKTYN